MHHYCTRTLKPATRTGSCTNAFREHESRVVMPWRNTCDAAVCARTWSHGVFAMCMRSPWYLCRAICTFICPPAGSDDDDAPPDLDDPSVRFLAASSSSSKWQHSAVIGAAPDRAAAVKALSRVVCKQRQHHMDQQPLSAHQPRKLKAQRILQLAVRQECKQAHCCLDPLQSFEQCARSPLYCPGLQHLKQQLFTSGSTSLPLWLRLMRIPVTDPSFDGQYAASMANASKWMFVGDTTVLHYEVLIHLPLHRSCISVSAGLVVIHPKLCCAVIHSRLAPSLRATAMMRVQRTRCLD